MSAALVGKGWHVRLLVRNTDLAIISNNCWGAHVYQALGIPYSTPFVGLFVDPESYLLLLQDFDRLVRSDLRFVQGSRLRGINEWRAKETLTYPIAMLGDIVEINFQHYASEAEALDKWTRRRDRMTTEWNRRFFKFDDRDGATEGQIVAFSELPLAHKVCFTGAPKGGNTIVVPGAPGTDYVVDGVALARSSAHYFNTLRWISSAPSWLPLPSLI